MDGRAQDDVIAYLSEPGSYGPNIHRVERHETHGAIVFLAGDRAYKLKRAVKFPYMDYSTADLRKQMCMRELAVNRRTAPQLYLEVRPIVEDDGVLRFGSETESDRAVDWVVVMQRFEQDALLKTMCQSGRLTSQLMRLAAEAIARFHATAEVARDFGGEAGIRAVIEGNAAVLRSRFDRPFAAERVAQYESTAQRALSRVAGLLEERRTNGHVCRCHGDLHLNNIFVHEGQPVLFDAIEFNDRFACIDVLYDLAFLLMDLDHHGARGHANTVFNRYLELAEEHAGLAAMPLFLSCRAAVRAHTIAARADTCDAPDMRLALLQEASAHLNRAVDDLLDREPRLVAIGGASGTGKSTLAYGLAPFLGACPGAVVIRSDIVRKRLMGVADTVHLPADSYTASVNRMVYERIEQLAAETLASGFSAIADAVYAKAEERREIEEIARHASARFDGLWLEAPQALLEQRISLRHGDASDATPGVLRAQLGYITAPETWATINAAVSADGSLAQSRRILQL